MNLRKRIILPLILILLVISACNMPADGEETESPLQVQDDLVVSLPSPTLPTCGGLGSDFIFDDPCPLTFDCYPELEVIGDFDPTYEWVYPSWYDCHPSSYELRVTVYEDGEDYMVELSEGPYVYQGIIDEIDPQTGGPYTSVTTGVVLEPLTRYAWSIRALLNGIEGRWDYNVFWTGPICDSASLVAPELIEPDNGFIVSEVSPSLIAWYPQDQECLPLDYEFQLSTDSNFSQLWPLTDFVFYEAGALGTITDCTRYYWRARAVGSDSVGPLSVPRTYDSGDGVGPFSETRIFDTRFEGECVLASVNPEIISDTLCYVGPDQSSEVIQSLTSGQEVELLGYSVDPLWYIIDSPSFPGQECWVPKNALAELSPEILAAYPVVTPPPTPPPPIPPLPPTATTPPKAADTTGPKVSGASASPNPALTTSPVTISATISDSSGVARAIVYIKTGKGGYQKVGNMKSGGGDNYFLNIGALTPAGTYTFRILAEDSLGNANCSAGNLDACPGGSFVVKIP